MEPVIFWPSNFDDISWEVESKGWLAGVKIVINGKTLCPVFYDPARLAQDVADEVHRSGFFAEQRLIVVARVTRESVESAVAALAKSGDLERMV